MKNCDVYYIFDVSEEYLNSEQFNSLQFFLIESINACFDKGIGNRISFMNLNHTSKEFIHPIEDCCDEYYCSQRIFGGNITDFVEDYYPDTEELLDNNTVFKLDYAGKLAEKIKLLSQNDTRCLYNSVTLITNRIVDLSDQEAVS